MPPPIRGSDVFLAEDLRRIFDALELARPDLSEALQIVRVSVGLQSSHTARWNNAGSPPPQPQVIDAQWRQIR